MTWILNGLYLLLLVFLSPVLLYRMMVQGKYRDGWKEKFLGRLPAPDAFFRRHPETDRRPLPTVNSSPLPRKKPRLWFHAVSVGEVLLLEGILAELLQRRPDVEIVLTTTTVTGLQVAREKFPQCLCCYCPLDFSWAVRKALQRLQPDLVVLVELELWPHLIREVHRQGLPLMLINGRISEKSFRGYSRVRFLMRRLLSCFTLLAVQNATYAERLRQLGAPSAKIRITGSVKFDRLETDRNNPATQRLRQLFGIAADEIVLVAGSTHAPEEEIVLQAWQELQKEFPQLRLILVPRHRERFEEVARLVEARGLALLRRSRLATESADSRLETAETQDRSAEPPGQHSRLSAQHPLPVLLLDTLGELSACWGLADLAFVGGSLTRRGGQNMIEPAGYGAALLLGPNTWNFREVVDLLQQAQAMETVHTQHDLTTAMLQLLRQPELRRQKGERAREVVSAHRGATAATVTFIEQALHRQEKTPHFKAQISRERAEKEAASVPARSEHPL